MFGLGATRPAVGAGSGAGAEAVKYLLLDAMVAEGMKAVVVDKVDSRCGIEP